MIAVDHIASLKADIMEGVPTLDDEQHWQTREPYHFLAAVLLLKDGSKVRVRESYELILRLIASEQKIQRSDASFMGRLKDQTYYLDLSEVLEKGVQ